MGTQEIGLMDRETVPVHPPPWALEGYGYILFFRQDPSFFQSQWVDPGHPEGTLRLGISTVMLVNYHQSQAGPYQELLLIPALYQWGFKLHPTITKIFVSTQASIQNGRQNWGIPKEEAQFDFSTQRGRETVKVTVAGAGCANFIFQPIGPTFPFSTKLVPPMLRTFRQSLNDNHYITRVFGKGRIQFAKVKQSETFQPHFPKLGQLLAAVKVKEFKLHFPHPLEIHPGKYQG